MGRVFAQLTPLITDDRTYTVTSTVNRDCPSISLRQPTSNYRLIMYGSRILPPVFCFVLHIHTSQIMVLLTRQ